jgi:hypothetical protein
VSIQRRTKDAASTPAPRIFARKRQARVELSSAGCWTSHRLANLPVMISTMLSAEACTDDMFAAVEKVVRAESRRRAAAAA